MVKEYPAATSGRNKTIYSLDSPYPKVNWPVILEDDQAQILSLLCNLLKPVGEYRSQHTIPSKGKRKRKRKQQENLPMQKSCKDSSEQHGQQSNIPEVLRYLTVGFNSTTRYLEALAQTSATQDSKGRDTALFRVGSCESPYTNSDELRSLAAVFVAQSDQSSILYSHLPLLIKAASFAPFSSSAPRLIMLSRGAEERLATILSIPRLGLIGVIDGAPDGNALIDFARRKVPEVDVPWFDEGSRGLYQPVNIKAIETRTYIGQTVHLKVGLPVSPDKTGPRCHALS